MMSNLNIFIRPLNIVYSIEGKFYDEVSMIHKIFSILQSITSTFYPIDENFTFLSFCEHSENKEIKIEFWNDIIYKFLKNKECLNDLDKITSLFVESLNSLISGASSSQVS